jgi:phosphate transport system substrate-binding protein
MLFAIAPPARAELITVGGTGSSGPLIQILFTEFQKQFPETSLRILDPPLGTNGALKALEEGRLDIVLVGRPLSPEQLDKFGQQFSLADTPFVMASRDGQRSNGFTLDELAQVYAGTIQKWDSGASIRLVLRGSFESDTLLLRSFSTKLDKALELAATRPGMAGAVNDLATARLIANTPNSLGPTTLGLLTTLGLKLRMYPLEGVAPSITNLKNGTYPWKKNLSVILSKQPSPSTVSFAEFMRTPKAQSLMEANDYLPAPTQ